MSETASSWLLSAMMVFAVVIVAGIAVTEYFYRRFGYPTKPPFLRTIRLRDGIEAISRKIEPALQEGFQVKVRQAELLILEKTWDQPSCVMTIEFHRPFGCCSWSTTYVNVKCHEHPWLSWRSGRGSNAFWLRQT